VARARSRYAWTAIKHQLRSWSDGCALTRPPCGCTTPFRTIDSFELADGDAADRVCRATRTVRHATSLGGVETTMERRGVHPGQEHIPPGLIRMSTACEDLEDIATTSRGVGAA
jgi:hypothetical protein